MADKTWKAFERRVATAVGGKRRGADFRSGAGGNDDIIHPTLSIECKLLSRVSYSDFLAAAKQAETNAPDHKIPLAVVKKKRAPDADALVVMRLDTFLMWSNR